MKQKKVLLFSGVVAILILGTVYYANGDNREKEVERDVSSSRSQVKNELFEKESRKNANVADINYSNDKVGEKKILSDLSQCAKYVRAIKKPSKQDLERIEKASRYGEGGYESLRPIFVEYFGKSTSAETIDKMMMSGKIAAYRHEVLLRQYAYGEIDKNFLNQVIVENFRLKDEEHKEFLTPDEYDKYIGPNGEEIPEFDSSDFVERKEVDFFVSFPNIRMNNPKIKTFDDLYEYIDADIVEKLIELNDEKVRYSLRLSFEVADNKISLQDSISKGNEYEESFNKNVKKLLTPKQQELVLNDELNKQGFEDVEEVSKSDEQIEAMFTPEQIEALEQGKTVIIPEQE